MERNQLLQQLNQTGTEPEHGDSFSENTQSTPSTSKNVQLHQDARSEFSIATPFIYHVVTE